MNKENPLQFNVSLSTFQGPLDTLLDLAKAQKVIGKKGRDSNEGKDALNAIGEVFSSLKLTPRLFDELCIEFRTVLDSIRDQEREILRLCTKQGKLDRKIFIKEWHGNETNFEWIPSDFKSIILFTTYCVVVFSILVQGLTIPALLRKIQ